MVFCQRRIRRISVFGSSAGSGLDFHTGGLDKFIVEPFGRPLMLVSQFGALDALDVHGYCCCNLVYMQY